MADTEKKRKGGFFRTLFNVKRWVASDQIIAYAQTIREQANLVFKNKPPERTETFDEAVKRLNLTEEDIAKRMKQFFLVALIYLGFAILIFGYAIWSMFSGYLTTMIVSLVLSAFVASQALREHFWYMQMKKRKLGCSFKEWREFILGVKK